MQATDEQVDSLIYSLKPISIKDQLKEFGKVRKEIEFDEDADYTALIEIQGFYPTAFPIGRTGGSQIDVFVEDFAVYGDVHEISSEQQVRIINAVYGLIY